MKAFEMQRRPLGNTKLVYISAITDPEGFQMRYQ